MKTSLLTSLLLTFASVAMAQIDIAIDTADRGRPISQMMYGIFYEDINHAADGGIYAELIRNRSFEDSPEQAEAWTVDGDATMAIESTGLLNSAQQQCLHYTSEVHGRLQNEGFWGINVVKGRQYELSMFVKVKKAGNLYAELTDRSGKKVYAHVPLVEKSRLKGWQRITATLVADDNDPAGCFSIVSKGRTDIAIDVVSLFPPTYNSRPNGLRPDLVQMLYELHPRFMRFPGGCFVEGQDTPDNAFRWERTIGPIEQRPGHWNKNWGYRTSDGLGFHEYLQLAEDLNAKPLYVTNIGIWHGGVTPLDSIDLWIDECLNALEYANGPTDTKYGALRAKNGHPEPFNLEYIEIGNENNQTDGQQTSDHYYDRYRLFRDAILAKYPSTHIIGDVAAWGTDHPRWDSDLPVDLVDEHYYRSPAWFAEHFHKYDTYDRSWPHVYCGEYAVTQGFGNLGNLNAALGEAVYMMGMENNGDMVEMSSYAPIFVNEHDDRWRPDMVRFNAETVMGTPSYYVQKLMADNLGTRALTITEGAETLMPMSGKIFTPDQLKVGLATWNTNSSFKDIRVEHADGVLKNACSNAADFQTVSGQWEVLDGALRQTSAQEECMAILQSTVGGPKYTLSAKARKESGHEGFILVLNYTDPRNFAWVNFGGWSNSQHGIEQMSNGGKSALQNAPGHIDTGRWYDLRVEVDGNSIEGYLDGKKVIEGVLRDDVCPGIFASASIDENTGELILKIVNTSSQRETANLRLGRFSADGATLTRLSAENGEAENTLTRQTEVYPVTRHLPMQGSEASVCIEPYSLNILRIKSAR